MFISAHAILVYKFGHLSRSKLSVKKIVHFFTQTLCKNLATSFVKVKFYDNI